MKRFINGFILFGPGAFIRKFRKKELPKNGPVLIHIGCGEFNDKRYINVDTRPGWHIDYVDSIENCAKIFPPNYADLVYACHVLEHISHLNLLESVKGVYRCLKKGGVFRVSVPNFDTIIDMYDYKREIKDIVAPLMGGQGYQGNFHHSVFNEKYLKDVFLMSGFREVRRWDPKNAPYHNFKDWSSRKINLYNQEWPISLNLEAVK